MEREVPAVLRRGTSAPARVCVTGVGRTRASSTMEAFLDGNPGLDGSPGTGGNPGTDGNPGLGGNPGTGGVLVLGFAAALRDDLFTGDLVVARRLLAANNDEAMDCDEGLFRSAEAALERSGARYWAGDTLTSEPALRTAGQKLSHGNETGALVATMEDYWLGQACARRGVPFLSVRSVLDVATQELPAFVTGLGGRSLPVQMACVALNLAMRPRHLPAVLKLRNQVQEAQDSLATFVISFLGSPGTWAAKVVASRQGSAGRASGA